MKKYIKYLFFFFMMLIIVSFISCDSSQPNNSSGSTDSEDQLITELELDRIFHTIATFEGDLGAVDEITKDNPKYFVTPENNSYSITYDYLGITFIKLKSINNSAEMILDRWDMNDFCLPTAFPEDPKTDFAEYFEDINVKVSGSYHRDNEVNGIHSRYASKEDSLEIILNSKSNLIRKFDVVFNFHVDYNSPQASLTINGLNYSKQFTDFLISIYSFVS